MNTIAVQGVQGEKQHLKLSVNCITVLAHKHVIIDISMPLNDQQNGEVLCFSHPRVVTGE
jgi:hypothetical protein